MIVFFRLACFGTTRQSTSVGNELEIKLNQAIVLAKTDPGQGLVIINECYERSQQIKNEVLIIKSLLALSDVNAIGEHYSLAFDNSGEALFRSEVMKDTLLIAGACHRFGVLYANFHQKEETEFYLKKAIQLSKILVKKNKITLHTLISRYFALTQAYRKLEMYKEEEVYLDSCYTLSKKIKRDPKYLDVEKGLLVLNKGSYAEAIDCFHLVIKKFDQIDVSKDSLDEKGYLSVIYAYLGDAYRNNGDYHLSEQYFVKSINLLKTHKRYVSHKASVLQKYSIALLDLGRNREAYDALAASNFINGKYYKSKDVSNSDFFTIRNKYHDELGRIAQKLALKNKKELQYKILLFLILFVLVILRLVFYIRNQKRNERLARELNFDKQKRALELIELKNKELTRSALKIIEKEEFVKSIGEHLEALPKSTKTVALLKEIHKNKINLWDDFNARFISVNKGFYDRLLDKIPTLSQGDLKICALIKLNFTGKEMAHLLGISIGSVHKSRYRLRKKMNLEREVNLTSFISSI